MKNIKIQILRLIYSKEKINGAFDVLYLTNENIIIKGEIYNNPMDLLEENLLISGKYIENKENGIIGNKKMFKFENYNFANNMHYFFNKIIKIPKKITELLLKNKTEEELKKILNNNPEELLKMKGLGKKTFEKILNEWEKHNLDFLIYQLLSPYGFSSLIINNIINHFYSFSSIENKIKENPYILLEIDGVSFSKIDKFALDNNIKLNYKERLIEGIKEAALNIMNKTGNTILNYGELYYVSKEILSTSKFELHELIFSKMISLNEIRGFIRINDEEISLNKIFDKEKYLNKIFKNTKNNFENYFLVKNIEAWIEEQEFKYKINLSKNQKNILKIANKQPSIFSLSGYAGSGKTMVSKLVMNLFSEQNKKIHCCAFSGVAANRIGTVSGFQSKTIHTMLGYNGEEYAFNETNKLPYDLIVLDEAGMVNLEMFYSLFIAIDWKRTKLFILGDPAQLPPVGYGEVYRNILEYNLVENVTLTEVFRQKNGNIINNIAQDIRKGFYNDEYDDNKYIKQGFNKNYIEYSENFEKDVLKILNEKTNLILDKKYNNDEILKFQVISPMKNGNLGTKNINKILQKYINKNKESLDIEDLSFKLKDKVIQLKNMDMEVLEKKDMNYFFKENQKIYNGQVGIVDKIEKNNIIVYFPYENQYIKYERLLLNYNVLDLAYCLTAHKVQGNEFDNLIAIFSKKHKLMLNSNYIYSTYTRAKDNLYLIGERNVIINGITNIQKNRKTILNYLNEK
jgi:exodeoxyribonuclease V alpha subunit